MSDPLVALTVVTALGCGLSAGALFAFSSFVMRALARLPAPQGIAAMNSINVVAVTPVFMTALFGTGLLCIALAAWALVDWHGSYSPYLVPGAAAYVIGVLGVTMAVNVPRNNALARTESEGAEAAASWNRYVSEWTAWNHARVLAGIAAAAALTLGLQAG
jgi:uncharacterized membrane protein